MAAQRWYWKAYFVVMTALTLVAIAFAFFPPSESTDYDLLVDWAAVPLYIVQLVGLFGFVYSRRIVRPMLWRLVFVASVIELLWTLYSLLADLTDAAESYWSVLGVISLAIVAMTVPMLIALYRYGFRSPELWARP
jgi:hypothetical protein